MEVVRMGVLIEQSLTHAFGLSGADVATYDAYRTDAARVLKQLFEQPSAELSSILHHASRSDDLAAIEAEAKRIRAYATDLVVVGMGGSSLNAEVVAGLAPHASIRLHVIDYIDTQALQRLMASLDWQKTHLLFVSKSGTTIELMANLAVLLGEATRCAFEPGRQCTIITMENNNPLHAFARANGIAVLAHDPGLCGRFSVLSAVGLLPAAILGLDIAAMRSGAVQVIADPASVVESVAVHRAMQDRAVMQQVVMTYHEALVPFARLYCQCWAESLGKHARASTPLVSRGPSDQHSQLQLYLSGPRDKFFTVLGVASRAPSLVIPASGMEHEVARLLEGKTLDALCAAEERATLETLVKVGCPLRTCIAPTLDEAALGAFIMQMTLEIALFGALLGINAFDQPAVESGKRLTMDYLRDG